MGGRVVAGATTASAARLGLAAVVTAPIASVATGMHPKIQQDGAHVSPAQFLIRPGHPGMSIRWLSRDSKAYASKQQESRKRRTHPVESPPWPL